MEYDNRSNSFGSNIQNQRNRQNQSLGHSAGGNKFQQGPRINSSSSIKEDNDPVRELPKFDLKNITKELFDKTADDCAKVVKDTKKKDYNSSTQLRRFYDEFEMWHERTSSENFQINLPFIYMMKAKVAYALGREKVDKTFKSFLDNIITQVEDINTLHNAKLFFEAFMGFYKQYRTN